MKDGKAVVLDVRTPEEIRTTGGPLAHGGMTASNLPLSDIEAGALRLSADDFEAKYGFAKPEKRQTVVMNCKAGLRGGAACKLAEAEGYEKVVNNAQGARGDNFNE